MSRRTVLRAGIGAAASLALGGGVPFASWPSAVARTREGLRVYVVSIDSLDPGEVHPGLMPNLSALRDAGVWYESVSVLPSSTLQSHAAMFTGALPQDNGIAWNVTDSKMVPQRFEVDHLFTRFAHEQPTVSTFAYTNWEPIALLFDGEGQTAPAGGFSADPVTSFETAALITPEPQFGFLHLVDADEVAHVAHPDEDAARQAREEALRNIDRRLGQLVDRLGPAWSRTILLVVSDHRMEFGRRFLNPENQICPPPAQVNNCGYRRGEHFDVWNELGAFFISVRKFGEESADSAEYVERVQDIAGLVDVRGVGLVVTRYSTPSLSDVGLDIPEGTCKCKRKATIDPWIDIALFARRDHTFMPLFFGQHGNLPTQPNVLLAAGGHPWLADRPKAFTGYEQPTDSHPADPVGRPSTLSIAPTVAWLFGLGDVEHYANSRLPYAFKRS